MEATKMTLGALKELSETIPLPARSVFGLLLKAIEVAEVSTTALAAMLALTPSFLMTWCRRSRKT